ncbi:hypothetical protein QUA42_25295 [Microcoleus sp. Pol11C2]|uniref:hypothetical protein n=1 Tax=Microcoleus sp. Pol11C2 TaxID=3055389 RepID=UPI002FCF332B
MNENHKNARDKYREILLEIMDKHPQTLGYIFVRGTAQKLARYLDLGTKIKLSGGQVRMILKQKKYVYLAR